MLVEKYLGIEVSNLQQLLDMFSISTEENLEIGNYHYPLKPYSLIKAEAECQYLRKNQRCGKLHQRGYVVVTKTNNLVLIGHCCAHNHLSIDGENVKGDLFLVSRKDRLAFRQARIAEIQENKSNIAAEIRKIRMEFEAFRQKAEWLLEIIPKPIVSKLVDKYKRGDFSVQWEYLKIKRDKQSNTEEKSWYVHDFGLIKGVGDWLFINSSSLTMKICSLSVKLKTIPSEGRISNDELFQAEKVVRELSDLRNYWIELDRAKKNIEVFCTRENLQLLPQLVSNREARADAVRSLHKILGEPIKNDASKYVDNLDKAFSQKYQADGLRLKG
ncbi:hypothetical protein [Pseudomonas aeruginosa]|uniref:hypothetical protein n=1 Tax=Pseudomonas aeruginosa TaxID=287 RepID=UPI000A6128DE|nr:hypothetical protein [Pseudomonas aeruginosa]RTS15654.1 hypothetical protein DY936_27550 [Pseudomonas aeruginosa]